MGDRVLVQFPMRDIYLDVATHPGQLSLAIPSWGGAEYQPCRWGVQTDMVRVWAEVKLCDPVVTHGSSYLSALVMYHDSKRCTNSRYFTIK